MRENGDANPRTGSIITRIVASIFSGILDFLMPRVCLVCERPPRTQALVCARCWARMLVLPPPICVRCGHPTYGEECRWCAQLPQHVTSARSLCWVPEGVGGEVVHKLKYDGWTGLAQEMAQHLARGISALPWEMPREDTEIGGLVRRRPVLVPVPLGRTRRRERGFNQSALLALALAQRWRARVIMDALTRARETRSQVRLTPDERSANVHGAFAAGFAVRALRGADVILVDDVVTTAATLNSCAAAVLAAGAATIHYITFGRARAAFDRRSHPGDRKSWPSASASMASVALAVKSCAPQKNGVSTTSTSSPSTI